MAELLLSFLRWLDMHIHFLRMKLVMRHHCAIHGKAYMVERSPGVICAHCNS